jgi:membrane fusion protein, multidrug efflux system
MDSERTDNDSANHPKRRRWIWFCAAALVLLGILLVLHNEKQRDLKATEAAAKPPAAAVTVAPSKTGDINIYINAIGTVTPVYTVTVFSQVTGKVIGVHYKEGELVRAGDPLVDIDPQPFQATLAQAEGTLDHDQSVLDQARIDLARYQAAWARNAIAKQQLDDQV